MSVSTDTYVILGIRLNADIDIPDEVPDDDITLLYDGMNGEYLILGHVIAKTDNDGAFDTIIDINPVSFSTLSTRVSQKIAALYGIQNAEPHYLIVSHSH